MKFKLKNKQDIKALAELGQKEYDELTKKYMSEQERQQAVLEEQVALRRQRKLDADEKQERER